MPPYVSHMPRRVAPERTAVADYVSRRLKRETAAGRGVAAEIARKTGFTSAHVANAKNWGTVGADFEIAMADYWGMTVGELRAAAAAEAGAGLAPFEAAVARVDGIVAPEVIAALRANPPSGRRDDDRAGMGPAPGLP